MFAIRLHVHVLFSCPLVREDVKSAAMVEIKKMGKAGEK
jgi:hypothetical protein